MPCATTQPADLAALLAFKAHVKDPLGILASNWTATAPPCSWVGVSCDNHGRRVTGLEFDGVPLQGSITPQLGNLSFLSSLVLNNTSLEGPVPSELGHLRLLQNLVLSYNSLSGTIPSTFGNLTRLQSLHLSSNNLFGGIPHEFQNLKSLQLLRLSLNDFSGPIPYGLFNNTPNLSVVRLGSNRLTGAIPDSIGSLSKLEWLVLENNLLSGPMPPAIFNMSQLQVIGITRNNLSGPIPGNESFYLPMLQVFSISENQFDGPIPPALSACQNLYALSIAVNNFTGPVPSWLATMPNLDIIFLSTNGLIGKIPVELSNCTGLRGLDLSENKLEGGIPPEFGQLRNLRFMSFANNRITGSIPESIGYLSNLANIDLVGNGLTGSVPISFGRLLNLLGIWVDGNQLSGNLDFLSTFLKCRSLKTISMSNNAFTGSLPPYIGNLNLQELDLSYNSLSGTIPIEISELTSLVQLHLDSNRLTGSIPGSVGTLGQIQIMTLSHNALSSTIPTSLWQNQKLTELDLSHNSFSGSLPVDVGKLTAISKIDLSSNQLSGDIPSSIGDLQMMIYLNLSCNLFRGSIPDSLGKLLSIEELDLSSNALSGAIPKSLANLTYLDSLNLSFNRLDGEIPEGGVFSNITLKSLMGNSALCGLPREGISPCQNRKHSRSKQLLLEIILPAVVALLVLSACLGMLVTRKINKQGKTSASSDTDMLNYQLISYHELIRATRNFSNDNLLGAGGFGKVFKGQLDDESIIAIKVLNMQDEVALNSFDIECRVLRMARHRNLVRIVSTCSNLDFKALVLEYMPNGSLNDWLYSNEGRHISFLQRLGIMQDVAMAMEYLHHRHFEVVLHFDLKPSNILLDMEMIAHVADFGVSKLLFGDDNSIVLTSMPGTVGYMAPEFGSTGKASRMSDVYSFGIVLLEIFTRKNPTDPMFVGELSLRQWVSQAFPYELSSVTDCSLLQDAPKYSINPTSNPSEENSTILNNCLVSITELGLLCSRTAPDERIPMDEVVVRLNKIKSNYCSRLVK